MAYQYVWQNIKRPDRWQACTKCVIRKKKVLSFQNQAMYLIRGIFNAWSDFLADAIRSLNTERFEFFHSNLEHASELLDASQHKHSTLFKMDYYSILLFVFFHLQLL